MICLHLICFSFLPLNQHCPCRQNADTPLPDALSLDRHQWCRQDADHVICVMYDSPKSHIAMAELRSDTTLTCIQKAFVQLTAAVRWPQCPVLGSLIESRHRLWPCVSYQSSGESPYRHVVPHLSYYLNKVWFIKCCQTLLLFGSHMFTVFLNGKERIFEMSSQKSSEQLWFIRKGHT